MSRTILSSPHKHDGSSVDQIMREVVYALLPGILLYAFLINWLILLQCLIAVVFALLSEFGMLRLRRLPPRLFILDYSVIITALLFALCLSPFTPFWVTISGIVFAVVVIKHAFGGIGHNPFNPAMAGYAFVLLSFPVQMTNWPDISGLADTSFGLRHDLHLVFSFSREKELVDAVSAATPLSYVQTEISGMAMLSEISSDPVFGHFSGAGWEWLALYFLAAGIWLCFRRVISWQMPVTLIVTVLVLSLLLHGYDAEVYADPWFHVITLSTMLCAFFIITDPVSSATTNRGKLVFAAGAGVLLYMIRTFGAFPDGVAFSVLLMNCAVPLLDHYLRPNVLGESRAI